ncbi:hypothetical protein [Lederbergia citrea]|uniref:Uncharacterized protein n=1 Tax=Lederbergia citrea TaxID=2833581 RepID=A0A942UWS8_9BACI|nr:hypothetical protein [Lederbergia citrea]MBS4205424.1 hypothetical protein [Lederbergia citrea]MBS4224259.1 hypothetical protein [Lederbergia citrea]
MGLFINKGEHPDVFKNNEKINEPNQQFSKIDYLSELVQEQKKAYISLNDSFQKLKLLSEQQDNTQAIRWKEIGSQLNELKASYYHHEQFENQVIEWLTKLDQKNVEALENEDSFKQELMEEINRVSLSNKEIMEKCESTNQELAIQINEQFQLQKQLSDQMSKQEDRQNEVISRMDDQEALAEKILRQIDHIRSILFERTSYLAEKIENGYKVTSSYVYKLMTGSDQPLSLLLMNQKKEEKQKTTD